MSNGQINYGLVYAVLLASPDAEAALKAFVDQEREQAVHDHKTEAVRLIHEYADLLDPTGDWPEGGFEAVIKAAGARHAARIVDGLTSAVTA